MSMHSVERRMKGQKVADSAALLPPCLLHGAAVLVAAIHVISERFVTSMKFTLYRLTASETLRTRAAAA